MRQISLTRAALAGLALAIAGSIGQLSLDTIRTAHAHAAGGAKYMLVFSHGQQVGIVSEVQSLSEIATASPSGSVIVCSRVMRLGQMAIGVACAKRNG